MSNVIFIFSLQTFGGQGQTAGEFFIVKHFQSFGGGDSIPYSGLFLS